MQRHSCASRSTSGSARGTRALRRGFLSVLIESPFGDGVGDGRADFLKFRVFKCFSPFISRYDLCGMWYGHWVRRHSVGGSQTIEFANDRFSIGGNRESLLNFDVAASIKYLHRSSKAVTGRYRSTHNVSDNVKSLTCEAFHAYSNASIGNLRLKFVLTLKPGLKGQCIQSLPRKPHVDTYALRFLSFEKATKDFKFLFPQLLAFVRPRVHRIGRRLRMWYERRLRPWRSTYPTHTARIACAAWHVNGSLVVWPSAPSSGLGAVRNVHCFTRGRAALMAAARQVSRFPRPTPHVRMSANFYGHHSLIGLKFEVSAICVTM